MTRTCFPLEIKMWEGTHMTESISRRKKRELTVTTSSTENKTAQKRTETNDISEA